MMRENNKEKILEIKDLKIDIKTDDGILKPVRGVNYTVFKGKTLGVVGESGCGKSLTSKSILGINAKVCKTSGDIIFQDGDREINLLGLKHNGKEIRAYRGAKISMIFQEPMTAFSPMYTIGNQIMESILIHDKKKGKKEAREIALDMMEKVGIANPEKRINQYPHEFSGGMLQRAMIAMALVCKPDILIADEPTTALDVTIQAQVLELMKSLQREYGMAIIFITHDLGTVAKMCDDVAVMYLGKVVEKAGIDEIFDNPKHPYTRGLLEAIPKISDQGDVKLKSIEGVVPIPINYPKQCGFFDRCDVAVKGICDAGEVPEYEVSEGHHVRCFKYDEELGREMNCE